MRDATELPLRLIRANLELQLRIAALIQDNPVPWCVVEGRPGGSAITVAAVNALASARE